MLPFRRLIPSTFIPSTILLSCLMPLAGCANSSLGNVFQRSLQADDPSKLNGSVATSPTTVAVANQANSVQLPTDFPAALPRYPEAKLQAVVPAASASTNATTAFSEVVTRWTSNDGGDRILRFYRDHFQANRWQVDPSPTDTNTLTARLDGLRVAISLQSNSSALDQNTSTNDKTSSNETANNKTANNETSFEIRYSYPGNSPNQTASKQPSPPSTPAQSNLAQLPPFSTSTSVGISGSTDSSQNQLASGPTSFSDLDKTPKQLQSYVQDLVGLGVLSAPSTTNTKANPVKDSSRFEPNQTITRRDYARWLVSTNNRLNLERPAQQIRLASDSSQPAFRDVPRSDPDFAVIQGLAEAGIVPSSLSGDVTAVTFRPSAPLTRDHLLLWKVPLDTRQGLPTATIDAVKQTWGFQDAAKIDPRALRAVLADYQNGDLSNIRRVFGYTTLFQPRKSVTRAEAAAALWYFGFQGEGQSAQEALKLGSSPGQ